ncbi:hypothetical protein DB347_05560 [Opitutaceae bacterium EW11]|nr:hypothetical protein DB347_05560 [Opitutaceae bacterium EW11]
MHRTLVVIPLFVSERTVSRVNDLLDAIRAFERVDDLQLLFVLDGDRQELFHLSEANAAFRAHVLSNPREGRGNGWSGGLVCGLLAAFRYALSLPDWEILLRLDDDAMVARPFSERARQLFAENDRIGELGYYEFGRRPAPGEYHYFFGPFYRRSKLLSHHDDVNGLWFSLTGWRRSVRLMIRDACRNGYVFGEFCQGGAYFLSRRCLERFAAYRPFRNPWRFAYCDFTEDFFFAIATRAVGMDIRYVADDDRFLNLKWKGLSRPAEELLREGYAIVHSVKEEDARVEERQRAAFRLWRDTAWAGAE